MGPAVLVTLGLLFLLANMSDYPFERTWPILLIVIGVIKVARYVIPDSGHINPGPLYPPPYGAVYSQQPNPSYAQGNQPAPPPRPGSGPIVTPPPAPIAGALGDGKGEDEVHNG
jgi:hypothetical protein